MKTFEVSMFNSRLNFRKYVTVTGCTFIDAIVAAIKLEHDGYDMIENVVCIGYAD